MTSFQITDRTGKQIKDWRDWTKPKKSYQWKTGRSAMELARAWFTARAPVVPPEVAAILSSSDFTRGIIFKRGQPEFVTPLPEKGEGRNHDLWLLGDVNGRSITVCVEAKCDEPFGEIISECVKGSVSRAAKRGCETRLPQRAEGLLEILFGREASLREVPWCNLHYQLLTGAAGTVIQAVRDGSSLAVFLVHEFLTESVDRVERVPDNAKAFSDFVRVFNRSPQMEIGTGMLFGPYHIESSEHVKRNVELMVGKATYDWSEREIGK